MFSHLTKTRMNYSYSKISLPFKCSLTHNQIPSIHSITSMLMINTIKLATPNRLIISLNHNNYSNNSTKKTFRKLLPSKTNTTLKISNIEIINLAIKNLTTIILIIINKITFMMVIKTIIIKVIRN